MKYLCCLQLAIGLAAMSSGLAGIILWTQTFLAYLPAVGAGIMFLMSGWYGIIAVNDKTRSVSKASIAVTLTLITLPVAVCILGVSLMTFSVYVQDKAIVPEVINLNISLFKSQELSARGTSVWVAVIDLAMLSSGLLQSLAAILTFRKLNQLVEMREEDQILKLLNYGAGPVTPPSRDSFTHAYGYNGPAFYDENAGMPNTYPYPPGVAFQQYGSRGYPFSHVTNTKPAQQEVR
uniref:Transmembrane protein n=1 Tax=Platynereis dumerilii TaxID=6359 RepID=A0A7S5L3V5_PLADU|nr:hypothetical protein [Platynereis dumerilii]